MPLIDTLQSKLSIRGDPLNPPPKKKTKQTNKKTMHSLGTFFGFFPKTRVKEIFESKVITNYQSFQLEVEPKFVHFGSEANLTIIKLDDSVENAHGLIMTAFDPFGNIVGQFIEDDKYIP